MKERLKQIVQYKTHGRIATFGELMGWQKQYSYKVCTEGAIGIQVVSTILQKLPEISARWFILGEGTMFDASYAHEVLCRKAIDLALYGKYLPVMTDDELEMFINSSTPVKASDVKIWEAQLQEKNAMVDRIFEKAYSKLNEDYNKITG